VALYLQYMEPHEPYAPPEPFRSRFVVDDDGKPFDIAKEIRDTLERAYPGISVDETGRPLDLRTVVQRFLAHRQPTSEELASITRVRQQMNARLYDGDVAAADEQMRRLFEDLERRGFLNDDTPVIVTADRGEEFLEHGGTHHGNTLYEESVRIPLILIGPGIPRGSRVRENVSLVDVAPSACGIEARDVDLPATSLPRHQPHIFGNRSLWPLKPASARVPAR
jgi:arylsulfatase A-like enzyme